MRVGIADGGFAARLAARRAAPEAPFVVEPGGSAAFCAPWPVAVLDDPELASLLVRLGLPTLGDVAALPADAVLARFGADGRRFHDLARGVDAGPPVLVTPPPDLVEQIELDPPVAAGRRGRVRGEGARRPVAVPARRARARVHAGGDRGRDRARRTARALLAARPRAHPGRARRTGALAARRLARGQRRRTIDEDLDDTTGGLTLLRLVPDEVVPADGRQLGFWGGDQAAHDRADRALARVQGMLGYEAVATAVVQGGRTPAEQVRWVPWGDAREPQRPLVVDTFPTAWPGALPSPFPGAGARSARARGAVRRARARGRGVGAGRAVGARRRVSSARCCRAVAARCAGGPDRGPPTCGGGIRPRAGGARAGRWSSTAAPTPATSRAWSMVEAGRAGVEAIYD